VGDNWTCVGKVAWPGANPDGSALTVMTGDPVTFGAVSGVAVSGCYSADTDCGSPFVQGITSLDGSVLLEVPSSPFGRKLDPSNYLQLMPDAGVPTLYYWGFPISAPQQLFPVGIASSLAELSQTTTSDPSLGTVEFYVYDCTPNWGNAVGVQVTLEGTDAGVRPFYFQGSVPSFTATETAGTSILLPSGGFLDVPPGTVTLTATPLAIGKPSSHATIEVRPGTITYVHMYPTP
jgi:hypothetical protein